MTSTIQSISFPADKYTAKRAMKWLKEHKVKPVKRVDKKDNMLRYRIAEPKEFGRFATKRTAEGITLTFGFKSDPEEKGEIEKPKLVRQKRVTPAITIGARTKTVKAKKKRPVTPPSTPVKAKPTNTWLIHVNKFRSSHPDLSYKKVLQEAKKTYKKKKKK